MRPPEALGAGTLRTAGRKDVGAETGEGEAVAGSAEEAGKGEDEETDTDGEETEEEEYDTTLGGGFGMSTVLAGCCCCSCIAGTPVGVKAEDAAVSANGGGSGNKPPLDAPPGYCD